MGPTLETLLLTKLDPWPLLLNTENGALEVLLEFTEWNMLFAFAETSAKGRRWRYCSNSSLLDMYLTRYVNNGSRYKDPSRRRVEYKSVWNIGMIRTGSRQNFLLCSIDHVDNLPLYYPSSIAIILMLRLVITRYRRMHDRCKDSICIYRDNMTIEGKWREDVISRKTLGEIEEKISELNAIIMIPEV